MSLAPEWHLRQLLKPKTGKCKGLHVRLHIHLPILARLSPEHALAPPTVHSESLRAKPAPAFSPLYLLRSILVHRRPRVASRNPPVAWHCPSASALFVTLPHLACRSLCALLPPRPLFLSHCSLPCWNLPLPSWAPHRPRPRDTVAQSPTGPVHCRVTSIAGSRCSGGCTGQCLLVGDWGTVDSRGAPPLGGEAPASAPAF